MGGELESTPEREPVGARRLRWVVVVVTAILLAGTAGLLLARHGGDSGADAPAFVGRVRATTTTSSPRVTPAALALSQPQDSPADPNADVPITQIATIEIPRIGLSTPVYEGVWLTVINVGPGHWPGTAMPGGYGNVVVAGHRVSNTHPFRRIDELRAGDSIVLTDASGTYTYAMTGSDVVTPDRIDIVTQRPGRTLTVFACHPPGRAEYRYVVRAQLVSSPRPVGA